jgi:hypothetical protein
MILMALDHVRDFFGTADNPTDPAVASAPLFFTRWITHSARPCSFCWSGRARISPGASKRPADSRFLLTRGL